MQPEAPKPPAGELLPAPVTDLIRNARQWLTAAAVSLSHRSRRAPDYNGRENIGCASGRPPPDNGWSGWTSHAAPPGFGFFDA
jgi:hypothetical protein